LLLCDENDDFGMTGSGQLLGKLKKDPFASQRWPEMTHIMSQHPGSPAYNLFADNTYCRCGKLNKRLFWEPF
jgi:hypothetical protein